MTGRVSSERTAQTQSRVPQRAVHDTATISHIPAVFLASYHKHWTKKCGIHCTGHRRPHAHQGRDPYYPRGGVWLYRGRTASVVLVYCRLYCRCAADCTACKDAYQQAPVAHNQAATEPQMYHTPCPHDCTQDATRCTEARPKLPSECEAGLSARQITGSKQKRGVHLCKCQL